MPTLIAEQQRVPGAPATQTRTHYPPQPKFRQHLRIVQEFGGELGQSLNPNTVELTFTRLTVDCTEYAKTVASYDCQSESVSLSAPIARVPGDPERICAALMALHAHARYCRYDSDLEDRIGMIRLHATVPCRLSLPNAAEFAIAELLADFTRQLFDTRARSVIGSDTCHCIVREEAWA